MITIARLLLTSAAEQAILVPDNSVFLGIFQGDAMPHLDVTIDDTQLNVERTVRSRYTGWHDDAAGQIEFDLSTHTYVGGHGDVHFWIENA